MLSGERRGQGLLDARHRGPGPRLRFHSGVILDQCCKGYTPRVSMDSPCEFHRARVAPHLRSPLLVRGGSYPPRSVALTVSAPS
ncbi:hypothetical protein A176_000418 [Myxococcus hansupus]|uniref:Uncharacterized protein n=1 Tax=Pseudomyxococcus hansupus TaxID=1297742 RepID=A0A0H4WJL0_9BACT|nr:hypothetical protein A176_000418 [Myxococcus hansupus]